MTHFTPAEERRLSAAALSWSAANRDREEERRHRWQSAAVAFRVVGKRDGATDRLSKLLGITSSAVEQMADGYKVFDMLRQMDFREAANLRKKHSYSRFYEVGILWAKYQFDVELLFEYIAADTSTSLICDMIAEHHDPLPTWHRQATSLLPKMKKFGEWGGVTPRFRRLAALWTAEANRLERN